MKKYVHYDGITLKENTKSCRVRRRKEEIYCLQSSHITVKYADRQEVLRYFSCVSKARVQQRWQQEECSHSRDEQLLRQQERYVASKAADKEVHGRREKGAWATVLGVRFFVFWSYPDSWIRGQDKRLQAHQGTQSGKDAHARVKKVWSQGKKGGTIQSGKTRGVFVSCLSFHYTPRERSWQGNTEAVPCMFLTHFCRSSAVLKLK